MARFSAILLAAALLVAGRLTHAAPSTAEVLRRADLPSSAVPDAVLRFLRPDNHFVTQAKVQEEGRPNPCFWYYLDDKRSSVTPAGDHSAVGARDDGDLGSSESSSKRLAAERAGELMGPFLYSRYSGNGNRPAVTADEEAAPYGNPFTYFYRAPTEQHHAGGRAAASTARRGGRAATTTTTVFFHEEAVRVGARLPFRFPAAAPAALGLLPRRVADSIPFTTAALPQVLALFGVSPDSAKAAGIAETLRTCELPPLEGEAMFCATSLEALVERAMAALGARDVRALTSTLPRAGAPLHLYTVRAVRPVDGESFVACHDEVYPYTVYRCHSTGPARAYLVDMEGARGGAVTVATVCHTDTSRWNPERHDGGLLQAPRHQARRRAGLPPHAVRAYNLGQEGEERAGIRSTICRTVEIVIVSVVCTYVPLFMATGLRLYFCSSSSLERHQ